MNLKIITPVATEPLTLAEAKLHLRVVGTTDDTLITLLIKAAREICENITNRALAAQTLELSLNEFPDGNIKLPYPPLTSVTSIKYKDYLNVDTTWTATEYIIDTAIEPGVVVLAYGKSYPSFTAYPTNAIKIRYVAGYTTDIPVSIKQAILILIANFYENRQEFVIGQTVAKIPRTIDDLLFPYRIWVF